VRRLFVPAAQVVAGEAALSSEQLHYLRTVLRLAEGDEVEVFDGEGARFRARLDGGALRLGEALPRGTARVDVVLVQSLAKGEKMDLVVQKATELGAARIVPLAAERAVVRLDGARGAARAERWRRVAQEASRQCGRADVPRVDEALAWEGVFRLLREEPERRGVLLDPEEKSLRLGQAVRGADRLLIAVGPEGGFSRAEIAAARANGLVAAGLGPLVLRSETAGLAALTVILHLNGSLG
jgi:16S rRNA (uracil1498-N3)-methyltransferase